MDDLLIRYLGTVTGETVNVADLTDSDRAKVPLFLKATYRLVRITLFGTPIILAVQKSANAKRTPTEYRAHLKLLREAFGANAVALVISRISAYARHRMVQQRIPFIIPGRQLYLPMLLVDFQERFPRPDRQSEDHVSWPAQILVLRHLHGQPVRDRSLRNLAAALGYSPMALSDVADELEALGVSESRRKGKSRNILFLKEGRQLWDDIAPRLRSPVLSKRWIASHRRLAGAVPAGLTALEQHTNINDDPIPTVAMRDEYFRRMLADGHLHECRDRDEAALQVECWSYDPNVAGDGKTVDRLSLFLTLRDSPDERIQQALQKLLENMTW